jgi:hypothetical protein
MFPDRRSPGDLFHRQAKRFQKLVVENFTQWEAVASHSFHFGHKFFIRFTQS